MRWIWLGVVVSLLLTEYLSRNFTAICFALSGIISCIMTKFTDNYMFQVGEFLIVGIILISFLRPILLKWIESKKERKNQKNEKIENISKRKENKKKK